MASYSRHFKRVKLLKAVKKTKKKISKREIIAAGAE